MAEFVEMILVVVLLGLGCGGAFILLLGIAKAASRPVPRMETPTEPVGLTLHKN